MISPILPHDRAAAVCSWRTSRYISKIAFCSYNGSDKAILANGVRVSVETVVQPPTRLVRTLADPRAWLLAVMFVAMLATNSSFSQPPSGDALDYRPMAEAAPGLPTDRIGSAYTGRIAIHYIVGVVSHLTGLSLDATYDLVSAILMATLLVVIFGLFRHLPVPAFAICTALFVFNPYTLRPYIMETDLLQDVVFVVGLGLCLLGLQRRSRAAVLIGLIVAVLGRQTAIGVAPVVALWVLFAPTWRQAPRTSNRGVAWPTALAAVTTTFAIFIGVKAISGRFSADFEPSILRDSVLTRLSELPGVTAELAAHFARTAVPLLLPTVVVVTLILIAGWRGLPFACWGYLLIALAIVAQPAMIDPGFPGFEFNEQRLSALAILPLVCATAEVLKQTRCPSRLHAGLLVAIFAVASLHHEFSSIGPQSLVQFLVLQLVAAIAVGALLVADQRGAPPLAA
jgi:hypothetical protein